MLKLKNIVKDYEVGNMTVEALKGIDIEFRQNEFVSVLGPSGCGKTTLLNIIGGLDRYSSGDLIINRKSTKEFKDHDWDAYRNYSVGFVFQTYNLISHQTVLANVELALTLTGVSKAERRRRATEVLEKVGLGDQLRKKPNQMSGGQMQRVAIARALINDPEILLADEPTGALDTETSKQIMDILKEVAKDRLVIMVTHNPNLAEKYSTRIVKLLDGKMISDSNPYHSEEDIQDKNNRIKIKRPSMSFFTALSLSLNNLMTKKTRTILTAFAGSIGIIGIALILSLSDGFQNYISKVEEDTLSSYPIMIEQKSVDLGAMRRSVMNMRKDKEVNHDLDGVYVNNMMSQMLNLMVSKTEVNNLSAFKTYIEERSDELNNRITAVSYGYDVNLNVYSSDYKNEINKVNPSTIFDTMGYTAMMKMNPSASAMMSMSGLDIWDEMLDNREFLESQYDVLAGRLPENFDEVVLIVDKNNEISDLVLYSLGLANANELPKLLEAAVEGKAIEVSEDIKYTYDEILDLKFKLLLDVDYYRHDDKQGIWVDKSNDEDYIKSILDKAPDLKVTGIMRASDNTLTTSVSGSIGYTSALTEYIINKTNESEIVKAQKENPDINVFTGLPFKSNNNSADNVSSEGFNMSSLSEEEKTYLMSLSEEERAAFMASYQGNLAAETAGYYNVVDTREEVLALLGVVDIDTPSSINIYAADFKAKEEINDFITAYNKMRTEAGEEEYVINYTDYVGMMMNSVSSIINTISYVLIAFVAISLAVSSIMIGIITYISVLERTKEIGILRSIGASKRDISRVFNAETLIIGFVSGGMGILISVLLCIPINAIIERLAGIVNVAKLPLQGAIILIAISTILTLIAGIIPSRIAAKKDPVVALRSE